MKPENIIQLFLYQSKNNYTLEDYNNFMKLLNSVKSLDNEKLKSLSNKVEEYFNFALDSFMDFPEYILYLYQNNELTDATEKIEERFSEESYQYDLKQSDNNMLYILLFGTLKEIFNGIMNSWKTNQNTDKYFNRITYTLSAFENSKKQILDYMDDKDKLLAHLTKLSQKISTSVKGERFTKFVNDVEELVSLVNSIVLENSETDVKGIIIKEFSQNRYFERRYFYSNSLSKIVRENQGKYKRIKLGNSDSNFNESLYDYVKGMSNSEAFATYFKNNIFPNLNMYLEFNSENNIYYASVQELSKLLNRLDFSDYLFVLLGSNVKLDYSKIDSNFISKFYQIVNKLNNYEKLDEILQSYSEEKKKKK